VAACQEDIPITIAIFAQMPSENGEELNKLLLLESQTDGRDAQPLWIGSPLYRFDITGGPSYISNRYALRRLVEEGLPYYFTNTTMGGEDCAMGAIMAVLHIHLVDTSDAGNRQRFFHYDLPVIGSR
jgi:hypothetical protein